MIVDSINNLKVYESLKINSHKIMEFIERVDELNLEDGKYEILGENLFAMVQTYETKPENQCRFETHNQYVDIQYIRKGKELMNYKLKDKLIISEDLSETKDVIFYEDTKDYTSVLVEEGSFALFLPQDGHKPGIKYGEIATVKKIVFKIKVA